MTERILSNERAGAFCLSIESSDFASGSQNESKRACFWNQTTKVAADVTTTFMQFRPSVHHGVKRNALGQGKKVIIQQIIHFIYQQTGLVTCMDQLKTIKDQQNIRLPE